MKMSTFHQQDIKNTSLINLAYKTVIAITMPEKVLWILAIEKIIPGVIKKICLPNVQKVA